MDISSLNKEQQEVVTTLEGPVLVLAGAGSGKTKSLTHRLVNLIEHGVDPNNILLLTFTNKAANEMTTRAKIMLETTDDDIKGMTYHSFCAELLRHYANHIKFKPNFTVCDDSDSIEILNLVKEKQGYDNEDLPSGKELSYIYSYMLNKEKDLKWVLENKYPKYICSEVEIENIKEAYNEYKLEKNIFDYDDLLLKVIELFETKPGICRSISDKYKYIMVDEYQDSNLLQMKLLKLLRQFDNKNLCVVGDPNQSIYSWRGSVRDNILNFPDDFEDCTIIKLNQNYRSNQEILDLSNAIMKDEDEKFRNDLKGTYEIGYQPKLICVNNTYDEAQYVLNQIKKYHRQGVPYSNMGILIRRAFDSNILETMITEDGSIEYEKFGGIKFLEKAIVKNLFAYLKVLVNYEDEISWFRLLKLYPSIGAVTAKKIAEDILKNGIEVLMDNKYSKKKYNEYLNEIYDILIKLSTLTVEKQLDELINKYYYKVMKRSINNSKSPTKTKNQKINELDKDIDQAQALITIAQKYKSTSKFLNDLTLDVSVEKEINNDKLIISTVHSAKGLEFEKVFILNCVDGVFPTDKEPIIDTYEALKEHELELEEEKRIFYVAITRAMEDLIMMFPMVNKFTYTENKLSRFLDDSEVLTKITKINNAYY